MIFQIYEWLSKVVRQLQEPHTSEEDSLKTASRNHSKIKLEMSTCSKQYETLKLMHSQNQESPPESPKGNSLPCLLYTSPSPRDKRQSRMPSSA